jgi:hypothetical protein
MLLLYCNIANATVVAIHDDSQAAVPITAYGAAGTIRIVPWSGNRGDLMLSGPAPTPPAEDPAGLPMPDTRLYAQPTETPTILKAYAAQVRYNYSVQGVSFTTAGSVVILVNSDRLSQSLLNNLAAHAATLAPTDPVQFTQNNVAYDITAQDAIGMFNAVMAMVQNVRNIEANCIADQDLTTPTMRTYADIDNAFSGAKRK